MTDPVLIYPLCDGYIHNWLVLGPFDVTTSGSTTAQAFDEFTPLPHRQSTVPRELDSVEWKGRAAFWITATCADDHQLDWSGFLPVQGVRRGWAFAQIESPTAQTVTLHAATMGPLHLWHNGNLALATAARDSATQQIVHHTVTVAFNAGINHILTRLDQVGVGDIAVTFGLCVSGEADANLHVNLPTVPHNIALRQRLEASFAQSRLDRAVYANDQPVVLVLDAESDTPDAVHMRLQRPSGAIFSETTGKLSTQEPVVGARGVQLPSGEMHAVIMPPLGEFYEAKLRARRTCPFWVVRTANKKHVGAPERLLEAVQEAARSRDLFAEIAHIALGQWEQVRMSTIQEAAQRVQHLHADSLAEAVGLSGLLVRLADPSALPAAEVTRLRDAVRVFLTDAPVTFDLAVESDQLLFLAAWVLAYQHDPAECPPLPARFTAQDAATPELALAAWLAARGQQGFADIRSSLDHLVLALSHLVELVEETLIRELAAVLLDRLLYDVAIHSIYGVYAPARGAVTGAWLRSGRFTPESALGRLLWGMGSYDGRLGGAISLGLAGNVYQLPDIIRSIALDRPQSMWVQERRRGNEDHILVSYKTPNFLLSSLQDYSPGHRGQREQAWQATLGPEALIFTNHPTTFSQSNSRTASWWVGNGARPRVYQWQDALVALYRLPEDDILGFTHAYFPTYAFDEYAFGAGWAFARVGTGYAALWAAQGFDFVKSGQDAYRELRSVGRNNAWVCQMGNAGLDGDFAQFQQSVIAQPLQTDIHSVTWQTIRGDRLHLPWDGDIARNGENVGWDTLPHHQSPYAHAELPALHMDIGIGSEVMRLDFRI
ncbi:hypothetical protein GC175_20510 [bacterium]|nr:hypothetical protein [bacterium]